MGSRLFRRKASCVSQLFFLALILYCLLIPANSMTYPYVWPYQTQERNAVFSPDTGAFPNIPHASTFPNIPHAGTFSNIPQAFPNIPQAGAFPNIPPGSTFPNIPQWPSNVPYMFPLTYQGSTTSLPKVSDALVTIKDEPAMPTNKISIHNDPSKQAKSHVVGKEFPKKYGMYMYVYNDVNKLITGSRW